jgi:hypothetical protein
MNSLNDLNIFSQQTLDYTDDTPFSLVLTANTEPGTVSVAEDAAHAVPAGTVISLARGLPAPIIYTLDLSNVAANVTCSWTDTLFPPQIEFDTPSPGVFRLTGLNGAFSWDTYKSPLITVKDQTATYAYTANLSYPNPANSAARLNTIQPFTVTISNTHAELSSASTFNYVEDQVQTITGVPQITDTYSGPGDYRMTVTPNITAPVFRISTANSTYVESNFNTQTKVLTLTGSRSNVNGHLSSMVFTPTSDATQTFSLAYSLTNPISNLVTSVSQTCQAGTVHAEYSLGNVFVWEQNDTAFSTATITDTESGAAYNITLSRQDTVTQPTVGNFIIDGVVYSYSSEPELEPEGTGVATAARAAFRTRGVNQSEWNTTTRAWRQRNADSNVVTIGPGDVLATTFYRQVKIGRDGELIEQTGNTYNGLTTPGDALVFFANSSPRYSVNTSLSTGEDHVVQMVTGDAAPGLIRTPHPRAAEFYYSGGFYQVTPDPETTPGYFSWSNFLWTSPDIVPGGSAPGATELEPGWVSQGTSTPRHVGNIEWSGWTKDAVNNAFDGYGIYYRPPYDYTGPIVLEYRQVQTDPVNNTQVRHPTANIAVTISATHSEYTAPANVSATLMTPVKPNFLITDVDDINADPGNVANTVFQNYTATFSVDSGVLAHGNISLGNELARPDVGAQGNVITLTNLTLNELNSKLTQTINGAVRYTPTLADGGGNGTANISIVVNRNLQDNTEIANITIPVSYTAIAQGATSDGGFYVGNLKVSDGFPSNYHLIARLGKTTTGNIVAANVSFTQFANTGTGNTQMIAFQTALGNSAVSGYDGQTNTTALSISPTPQAVALVNAATTGAGANASVTFAHDDWYLPSYEEALLVNSAIDSVSGQTRTADAWTSTCPDGNSVKLLSGNVVTFDTLRTTTPSPQYNYYLVRRVPSST